MTNKRKEMTYEDFEKDIFNPYKDADYWETGDSLEYRVIYMANRATENYLDKCLSCRYADFHVPICHCFGCGNWLSSMVEDDFGAVKNQLKCRWKPLQQAQLAEIRLDVADRIREKKEKKSHR